MSPATLPALDPDFFAPAQTARAWPFEEARKLVKRLEKSGKGEALFETGYGPSGLPHIGTFGEVARTTMVRTAFRLLTRDEIPTRLICFSDDLDGMRKIPDTVPSKAAMEPHLQKPLTSVPDPWTNEFASFGEHNNAMLRRFLDTFGFDYEFASATDYYKSGKFDTVLLRAAERYDDIMKVMLPTLGPERQATYSPFLPLSPKSGRVLYVPMKSVDAKAGTITFLDEDGEETTLPVTTLPNRRPSPAKDSSNSSAKFSVVAGKEVSSVASDMGRVPSLVFGPAGFSGGLGKGLVRQFEPYRGPNDGANFDQRFYTNGRRFDRRSMHRAVNRAPCGK